MVVVVEGSEAAMELPTGTSTGGTAGDGVRKGLEGSQEQESQGIWEERQDRDQGRTGVGEEAAATEVDSEVVGRGEVDHGEEKLVDLEVDHMELKMIKLVEMWGKMKQGDNTRLSVTVYL